MCGPVLFPRDGLGCGLLSEALLLVAVALVDGSASFLEEVANGSDDDEWVYRSVEASVVACLEAVEEEHQLGYLQVVELRDDDGGEVFELVVGELIACSAKLGEVDKLRDEPHDRCVIAKDLQLRQGREVTEVAGVYVLRAPPLHGGVGLGEQSFTVAIACLHLLGQGGRRAVLLGQGARPLLWDELSYCFHFG